MTTEANVAHLYLESEINTRYYRLLRDKYRTQQFMLKSLRWGLIAAMLSIVLFKIILAAGYAGKFSVTNLQFIFLNTIQSNLGWVVSAVFLFYPILFILKISGGVAQKLSVSTRVHTTWNGVRKRYENLYMRLKNDEYIKEHEVDKVANALQYIQLDIEKTLPKEDISLTRKAEKEAEEQLPHLYDI